MQPRPCRPPQAQAQLACAAVRACSSVLRGRAATQLKVHARVVLVDARGAHSAAAHECQKVRVDHLPRPCPSRPCLPCSNLTDMHRNSTREPCSSSAIKEHTSLGGRRGRLTPRCAPSTAASPTPSVSASADSRLWPQADFSALWLLLTLCSAVKETGEQALTAPCALLAQPPGPAAGTLVVMQCGSTESPGRTSSAGSPATPGSSVPPWPRVAAGAPAAAPASAAGLAACLDRPNGRRLPACRRSAAKVQALPPHPPLAEVACWRSCQTRQRRAAAPVSRKAWGGQQPASKAAAARATGGRRCVVHIERAGKRTAAQLHASRLFHLL